MERKTLEQRFNEKWKLDQQSGCWVWTGSRNALGYGKIKASCSKANLIAHRVAYTLHVGEIPDGMVIDHMCHNRACVNPKHLRCITQKQNLENVGGLRSDNKSGVRGVHRHRNGRHWVAAVSHHGRIHHAGTFDELADAHAAVVAKRLELFTHNDIDRRVS